jgi:hypothetical protein
MFNPSTLARIEWLRSNQQLPRLSCIVDVAQYEGLDEMALMALIAFCDRMAFFPSLH